MISQNLEQMLKNNFVPEITENRVNQTIDLYAMGTTVLYSSGKPIGPSGKPMGFSSGKPLEQPDFQGSLGQSMGQGNYIKQFPNGDRLKVHAPYGIVTGAKFNDNPINNYEACIHDLRDGIIKKNTGGEW
ncbi:MAG: hypothetical protein PHT94_03590 [Candidatus Nanoarchaeia archaeon]|nr:hypothetical protein [Candidatus Nanoarchaeia archaeon]